MNILYGVSGEGFGHSSRSREIISHLQKNGNKVLVVCYGQSHEALRADFDTFRIDGIVIQYQDGKMRLLATLWEVVAVFLKNVFSFRKIKRRVDEFCPDMCITDFEPITAIISFWYRLPLISIDNQHIFTHTDVAVPEGKGYALVKLATNACVSRANVFIVFSLIKEKVPANVHLVSPVIRSAIQNIVPTMGDHILVYQTKRDEKILEFFNKLPEKFIVYGYNKDGQEDNIVFRKSGPDFIRDLAGAKAVIASAGLSLLSEAIFLKKPFFAVPLRGQFEQTYNATVVSDMGFGEKSESPTQEDIARFLSKLEEYSRNISSYRMDPNEVFTVLDGVLVELKIKTE